MDVQKQIQLNENLVAASQFLSDLSNIFIGCQSLRIEKNGINFNLLNQENLSVWFNEKKSQLDHLNLIDHVASRLFLMALKDQLKKIQEYYEFTTNYHVIKTLDSICGHISLMDLYFGVRDDVLTELEIISDISYAWLGIYKLLPTIHRDILSDPELLVDVRYLILYLSSAIEIPLIRINQSSNRDFVMISKIYSDKMVDFLKENKA
ncbi:hypothetical protein HZS_7528, partial [Henneguya salminicola]